MEVPGGHRRIAAAMLKSMVIAFLLTAVLLLILSWIMLKLQPDLKTVETGVLIIYVLSSFGGGWYSGKKAGKRKFFWGFLTGILYFLILLAVSLLSDKTFQSGATESAAAFLLCAAGGMAGGMLA